MAEDSRKLWYSVYTGGASPVTKFLLAPSAADSSTLMFDTSCCCSGSGGTKCVLVFEASCSRDDSGEGGWTEPSKINAYCVAESVQVDERWHWAGRASATRNYVPGIECGTYCSNYTATVPKPDMNCECYPVFGVVGNELPHYNVAVALLDVDYYNYVSSMVGTEMRTFLEWVTHSRLPVWAAGDNTMPGLFDYVVAHMGPVTVIPFYLNNFVMGPLDTPEECSPPDQAFTDARRSAYTTTYDYKRLTGSVNINVYPLPQAGGIYLPPANGLVWYAGGAAQSLEILAAGSGARAKALEGVNAADTTAAYSTVFEPTGWRYQFDYDQWGSIEIQPDCYPESNAGYVSVKYAREPRGGMVRKQDLQVSVGAGVGELPGCPLWLYRLFIETEFPYSEFNDHNYVLALSGGMQEKLKRADFTVDPDADVCPTYYHITYGERWRFCPDGDVEPAYMQISEPGVCDLMEYVTDMEGHASRYPSPFYDVGTVSSGSTIWLHEVDEAVDQYDQNIQDPALRAFNYVVDGHAYKVIKLDIHHFPSWFSAGCVNSVAPGAYDVPKIDFSDRGWECDNTCGSSECYYDDNNRAMSKTTFNDGFVASYGPVGAIGYNGVALADEESSVVRLVDTCTDLYDDGGMWYIDGGRLAEMRGCPLWNFDVYAFVLSRSWNEYLVTSGEYSRWVADSDTKATLSLVSTSLVLSTNAGTGTRKPGKFTYQGNVPKYEQCGTYSPKSIYIGIGHSDLTGTGTWTSYGTRSAWDCRTAGVLVYQYPDYYCSDGALAQFHLGIDNCTRAALLFQDCNSTDCPGRNAIFAGEHVGYDYSSGWALRSSWRTESRASSGYQQVSRLYNTLLQSDIYQLSGYISEQLDKTMDSGTGLVSISGAGRGSSYISGTVNESYFLLGSNDLYNSYIYVTNGNSSTRVQVPEFKYYTNYETYMYTAYAVAEASSDYTNIRVGITGTVDSCLQTKVALRRACGSMASMRLACTYVVHWETTRFTSSRNSYHNDHPWTEVTDIQSVVDSTYVGYIGIDIPFGTLAVYKYPLSDVNPADMARHDVTTMKYGGLSCTSTIGRNGATLDGDQQIQYVSSTSGWPTYYDVAINEHSAFASGGMHVQLNIG